MKKEANVKGLSIMLILFIHLFIKQILMRHLNTYETFKMC